MDGEVIPCLDRQHVRDAPAPPGAGFTAEDADDAEDDQDLHQGRSPKTSRTVFFAAVLSALCVLCGKNVVLTEARSTRL